jgi:hypothetical protein
MTTLDVAIDDYLHTIVRTRPWTKKREEELLESFSAWFYAQPAPHADLAEINPLQADTYAALVGLSNEDRRDLFNALHNLFSWSVYSEAVDHNPFIPA